MVARGDLGLQVEIENVPAMQKRLIQLCNRRGKPVITATEMLKSMTTNIEPTRAEATDVFNAIVDGTDAIMLSEETASGTYPYHAVRKMISIAVEAEQYAEYLGLRDETQRSLAYLERFPGFFRDAEQVMRDNQERLSRLAEVVSLAYDTGSSDVELREEIGWYLTLYREKVKKAKLQRTTDRITQAACTMSEADEISGILARTTSGRTVRMIARIKPRVPIVGATHDSLCARKLIISYGVWPLYIGDVLPTDGSEGMFQQCIDAVVKSEGLNRLLGAGDLVFTAGAPIAMPGTTNTIQIRPNDWLR